MKVIHRFFYRCHQPHPASWLRRSAGRPAKLGNSSQSSKHSRLPGRDQVGHGYRPICTSTGLPALSAGRSHDRQKADILYLDPPYPGVTGYETYGVLDSVLAGEMIRPKRSLWSTPQFTLQLLNLLDAAAGIPLWIISYGSVGTSLRQVMALVEEYRPARAVTIAYPHLQAIARQEVSDINREHLIIAERS